MATVVAQPVVATLTRSAIFLVLRVNPGSNAENGSGDGGSKESSSANSSLGNVCRFLSKEDVSKAIGVEIVRADPGENGCTYIAKGTQADMTAKHMKAMLATQ